MAFDKSQLLIISGGQTGVDIAGLRAARSLGIPTGGMLPAGCRTQNGLRPDYIQTYGMIESASPHYPVRTQWNVERADATLRIAHDWDSRGEKCTERFLQRHKRPYYDVTFHASLLNPVKTLGSLFNTPPVTVIEWILSQREPIRCLNIAGNSEKTCPKIEYWTEKYLKLLFAQWIVYLTAQETES